MDSASEDEEKGENIDEVIEDEKMGANKAVGSQEDM